MRKLLLAAVTCVSVLAASCGGAPHEYPASAKAQFNRTCPAGTPLCDCTWDNITRAMPYEDYEAAMTRFRSEGLMDPRLTRARTQCVERHPS